MPHTFESFWATPTARRWFSARDAASLASTLVRTCGGGRTLDIGCGSGALLHELRLIGIAAIGIDSSPAAVAICNAAAPGSASLADAFSLPFPDESIDTVVCCGLPDLLDAAAIHRLIREMARVARQSVVVVSVGEETWKSTFGDSMLPTSIPTRTQVDTAAFDAGLCRHPMGLRATPYAALEADTPPRLMIYRKLPAAAQAFPISWLESTRDLHMDHLRSSGRRADAHLARYMLAAEFVREGDQVLDVACGMGYGARMLACASPAANVLGLDNSPRAIEYARACHASARVSFREADAVTLDTIAPESVDFIASFETLEHVIDPQAMLERCARALSPGGRLIVSVPNDWTDESGNDPNPHHLHVYTRQRVLDELKRHFTIERSYRQTAGGGWKLGGHPRAIEPVDAIEDPGASVAAEWWLVVAMKSPIGADKASYRESMFPSQPADQGYRLYNFTRDYDNPALFRSMICMGPRMSDDAALQELASRVLATARRGSPDHGAAACVLAYQTLKTPSDDAIAKAMAALDDFDSCATSVPHARRWVISNAYTAAKLELARGRRDQAALRFKKCAAMDALEFSPLLGTKTVDAACWTGILHALDNEHQHARDCWISGIREARRLVTASWLNVIGEESSPQPYGLHELSQVIDAASHCAGWLAALPRIEDQPGFAWIMAQRQTFGDSRQYIKDLNAAKLWLESQVAALSGHASAVGEAANNWRAVAQDRETTIIRLRDWAAELEQGRNWLKSQVASYRTASDSSAQALAEVRAWAAELEQARNWLESQVASYRTASDSSAQALAEARAWADELNQGRAWLEGQLQTANEVLASREQTITELREHIAAMEQAKAWHEAQAVNWRTEAANLAAMLREATAKPDSTPSSPEPDSQ